MFKIPLTIASESKSLGINLSQGDENVYAV